MTLKPKKLNIPKVINKNKELGFELTTTIFYSMDLYPKWRHHKNLQIKTMDKFRLIVYLRIIIIFNRQKNLRKVLFWIVIDNKIYKKVQ